MTYLSISHHISSNIRRKYFITAIFAVAMLLLFALGAQQAQAKGECPKSLDKSELTGEWGKIISDACGSTVKFHAWGGADNINDYIAWAGKQLKTRYNIKLEHVKISNTADSVQLVLADKTAGKHKKGAVDLIWINGENFRTMKNNQLLYGPFTHKLPHFKYVDVKGKPTTILDFTVPTDGYESPWGMAQLVFIYDSARTKNLPNKMQDFLKIAKKHPGRLSYPAPPDFLGTTFLKQALVEFAGTKNAAKLAQAPGDDADKVTAKLWQYLDDLHPLLWQKGDNFPKDWPAQNQLLADGELYYSLAFNPNDASSGIIRGVLPKTVRTFVLKKGTIGNTHFLAIPYNSANNAGAMILADLMLSPLAQSRKADPNIWGDPTVLDVASLPKADKAVFAKIPLGEATLTAEQLGKVLPEPHPSWSDYLKTQWLERYGS